MTERYIKITSFPDLVLPEPNLVKVETLGTKELVLSIRRNYLKVMDSEWITPDEQVELDYLNGFNFIELFRKPEYEHLYDLYATSLSVFEFIRNNLDGDTRRKYDFRAEGVLRTWLSSLEYEHNGYSDNSRIINSRHRLKGLVRDYTNMFTGVPNILKTTGYELEKHTSYINLTKQMVRLGNGDLASLSLCTRTVYPDYYVRDTSLVTMTSGGGYALHEHTVIVSNKSGGVTVLYKGGLRVPIYLDTETGNYYDYDPSEYPFVRWNGGHMRSDYSKSTYSVIRGMPNTLYDHTIGKQDYNDDVLDYLPGFRTLEGEESVRGHKVQRLNTLFMGVELEVDMSHRATLTTSEAVTEVMKAMQGQAICVHDGSLNDSGFEIVSVPATLGFHYGMWEELCTGPLRKQLVSYIRPECGLHIHLSKEAFSDYTLGMFNTFINSSHNNKFISDISGRKPNTYCARKETKVTRGKHRNGFVDVTGERHGKYFATNLQKPHTLEVRMFKGTLAYGSLLKSLEFCHALHKFVSYFAAHHMLKYEDFLTWFSDKKNGNRKTYPYLWTFLCSRSYITDTSKAMLVFSKGQVSESLVDSGTYNPLTLEESAKAFGKDHETMVDPHVLELFRKLNTHKVTKLNS